MLYLNVLSLPAKVEEIEFLLNEIAVPVQILVFTETWLTNESGVKSKKKGAFSLSNYQEFHDIRTNQRGGGVSIYIHKTIKCRVLKKVNENNVQIMIIDLIKNNIKIGVIYRPPNHANIKTFENVLEKILESYRNLLILGDMNIDILDGSVTSTRIYDNIVASHYFKILNKLDVQMATRINHRTGSKTLIDHVVSDLSTVKSIITNNSTISDHRMIVVGIELHSKAIKKHKIAITNLNDVTQDLSSLTTETFESFHAQLIASIEKHTREIQPKIQKTISKPWFDRELRKSSKMKDKFYKLHQKYPSSEILFQKFKYYQRSFRRQIKRKKRKFYESSLKKNAGNSRATWAIINEIITNSDNNQPEIILEINNQIADDPKSVADEFNQYFASVGSKIQPNFIPSPLENVVSLDERFEKFDEVTEPEVAQVIQKLKNTSAGYDKIKPNFLKANISFFTTVLTILVNQIFQTCVYPTSLKVSKVKPIHKDGPMTSVSNYRPISIPSILSKVVETLMKIQLTKFSIEHNLISELQFGFLENSSTESAVVALMENIIKNLELKQITACLFIDVSKAFDCLHYDQLKYVLQSCGIVGNALNLIMSYLSGRKQFVEVNTAKSDQEDVTTGLPQGTTLIWLFLIYINPIFKLKLNGSLIMFADDAVLVYGATDHETLQRQMTADLETITKFFQSFNMKINYTKTKFMIFKNRHKDLLQSLVFDNNRIDRVEVFNYLGLLIDANLAFTSHANHVLAKISRFAGVLYRAKNFLNRKALLSLYFSNVQTHLLYLLPVWSSIPNSYIDRIQRMQNKILKTIYCKPRRYSTKFFYKNVVKPNIIMFSQMIEAERTILIYKLKNKIIRNSYTIPTLQDVTNRSLRRATSLRRPDFSTTIGKKSFFYRGVVLFNELPQSLMNAPTLQVFKHQLKQRYRTSLQ